MNRSLLACSVIAAAALTVGCNHDDDDDAASPEPQGSFAFVTAPRSAYTQVDRMGMPAVATAVITSKDAYNAATPADDAGGMFVGEITANVDALHAALDDDLTGAGLTPAADGVAQAAPLVVPDVIRIDTTMPAGFPNGRRLADPVIDVTLAVVLLELDVHPATTLAGLPLNPPANDRAFADAFPHLADPHTP